MSSAHTHTHRDMRLSIFWCQEDTTIAAEQKSQKKIESHMQKKNSLLRRGKTRRLGGKTLLNFTLEASAVVPYLCDSANAPGWKI